MAQHLMWDHIESEYRWVNCIDPKTARRIVEFMDYLDSCVNLEPPGPSRNRDFHMATECAAIKDALKGYETKTTNSIRCG